MTRHVSRLSGAVLACALLTGVASAQGPQAQAPAAQAQPALPPASPSHLAIAREVVIASGTARSFEPAPASVLDRLRQMNVTRPEVRQDLDQVIALLQPEMELQKQRMISLASAAMSKHLTEAELRELLAFFTSPVGKKYVDIQPTLFDDITIAMAAWEQELAEYVMIRARAEMRKRGHSLQ